MSSIDEIIESYDAFFTDAGKKSFTKAIQALIDKAVETAVVEARIDELRKTLHKNKCEYIIGWANVCEVQPKLCPSIHRRIHKLKATLKESQL